MEMKVLIPSPAVDFNFDSNSNSPYVSAPSSPQRFGSNYFSTAPTSPTSTTPFFPHFSLFDTTAPSEIPFNWEEKPGVPKRITHPNEEPDTDFAFDSQLDRPSLSADELFDDGKIKPLKPPPRLFYSDSPKSPKSPKKMFREVFSPRHRNKEIDPFSAAIEQTRREHHFPEVESHQRGRERTYNPSNSSVKHKGSRSVSPLRVSDMLFEPESNQQSSKQSSSSGSTWYNKWKLKDLLLFRSASEGSERHKKYAVLKKSESDDVRNSSFRSTDSNGGGSRRRKGRVSAHELHYTANRAVSEELRRKTFLPYKRGLLGCLGFNYPGVNEISRGSGSSVLTRERD